MAATSAPTQGYFGYSSLDVIYVYNIDTLTHTVTFNSNGGSVVAPQNNLNAGDLVIEPSEPTRNGYLFKGWYTDDITFTNAWNFVSDTIIGDITLYARWEKETIIESEKPSDENKDSDIIKDKNLKTLPQTGYNNSSSIIMLVAGLLFSGSNLLTKKRNSKTK